MVNSGNVHEDYRNSALEELCTRARTVLRPDRGICRRRSDLGSCTRSRSCPGPAFSPRRTAGSAPFTWSEEAEFQGNSPVGAVASLTPPSALVNAHYPTVFVFAPSDMDTRSAPAALLLHVPNRQLPDTFVDRFGRAASAGHRIGVFEAISRQRHRAF